ncbi:hypothetical protein PVAP13_2NG336123 [Panicum virgatum]|uniref:Uncharacterized protein n=1 Tax=Panicum virgatum TaxID=38727 RepID=A0A8T0VFU5_PANVG|nr:hypothetical protein PVAP13_2NG336123 [Panicum virgatum]
MCCGVYILRRAYPNRPGGALRCALSLCPPGAPSSAAYPTLLRARRPHPPHSPAVPLTPELPPPLTARSISPAALRLAFSPFGGGAFPEQGRWISPVTPALPDLGKREPQLRTSAPRSPVPCPVCNLWIWEDVLNQYVCDVASLLTATLSISRKRMVVLGTMSMQLEKQGCDRFSTSCVFISTW